MVRNLSTDGLGFWAPQNEQIELALSYGFASIDMEVVDFSEQVESRGMEKARRLIDSANIKLGAFPLPVKLDASDEDFQQQVSQLGSRAGLAARGRRVYRYSNRPCAASAIRSTAPFTSALFFSHLDQRTRSSLSIRRSSLYRAHSWPIIRPSRIILS